MATGRSVIEYIAVSTADGCLVNKGHRIHSNLLLGDRNACRRLSGTPTTGQGTGRLGSSGNTHVLEDLRDILHLGSGGIIRFR